MSVWLQTCFTFNTFIVVFVIAVVAAAARYFFSLVIFPLFLATIQCFSIAFRIGVSAHGYFKR